MIISFSKNQVETLTFPLAAFKILGENEKVSDLFEDAEQVKPLAGDLTMSFIDDDDMAEIEEEL